MYQVALDSLPDDLQRRWLSFRQAAESEEQSESGALADARATAPEATTDEMLAEHRLTEALKRYPLYVRDALLDEARRLMSIVERYIALPNKRSKITSCELNLEAAGSNPAFRVTSGSSGHTRVAEMADGPDTGSGFLGTRATTAGLNSKVQFQHSKVQYEFTPAVLALCKEAACTNKTILHFYKSRQHSIRKGTEPRIARAISPRTLDNWSRRVKNEGLLIFLPTPSGLQVQSSADPKKKDKRRAPCSPAAAQWIVANLSAAPHARALYKRLAKQAHKHGWTIPSQTWMYRKWKSLPALITSRNEKSRVGRLESYYPRDVSDVEALQIVVGDHSERDVTVRLPDGTLTRPWLTIWQCLRTLLIWGWYLGLTPSSRSIGLAYANGVQTFGAQPIARPDDEFFSWVYTDRGKDYRSHTISGKTINYGRAAEIEGGFGFLCAQRRVGLIDDLGLKQILARGYNAREKPVERTHRDISYWEQETFDSEYCGSGIGSKPDNWRDAYARHVRLQKKVARGGNSPWLNESPFMTLDDYREALTGYFFEYNHAAHERTTLGGAKVVPIEEHERLYTTRYEISDNTLAMLLLKAAQRQVGKNGVSLNGFQYLAPELAYYKSHKGQEINVEVRYSDDDYSRVWIIPPPTEAIPNPSIIEAQALIRGGVLRQNKETQQRVAYQKKFEKRLRRDHDDLTQSLIRGESVQDRVAALIEPEEEAMPLAVAVGDNGFGHAPSMKTDSAPVQARVAIFNPRLNRKSTSGRARPVTVEEVAEVVVDETLFDDETGDGEQGTVVKIWEDEDD